MQRRDQADLFVNQAAVYQKIFPNFEQIMMDSSTASPYLPIQSNLREIQLVHIQPNADFSAQLVCDLEITTIASAPPYKCLSYAWGEPNFTQEILLNNRPWKITWNLEDAMKHIRLENNIEVIWIDAISIHQSDLEERAAQVNMMREIYSYCQTDILWLGHADPIIEKAIENINHYSDLVESSKIALPGNYQGTLGRDILDEKCKPWNPNTIGIQLLEGKSSVWRRIWIVQELCNAPKILLLRGHLRLDWEKVERLLELLWHPKDLASCSKLLSIIQQRKLPRSGLDLFPKETSLDHVLKRFRTREATDPRDRMFGLLGLAPAIPGVEVDYRKNIRTVYVETSFHLLNNTRNLDIIIGGHWSKSHSSEYKETSFPSWAINFRAPIILSEPLLDLKLFRAGNKEFNNKCKMFQEGLRQRECIDLEGVVLGCIPSHWAPYRPLPKGGINELYLQLYQKHLGSFRGHERYITEESVHVAFWRTVVADCQDNNQQMGRLPGRSIHSRKAQSFRDSIRSGCSVPPYLSCGHEDTRIIRALEVRWHFVITDTNLFAMIPPGARGSDLIAVLDGAAVPVLLRPKHRNSPRPPYRIIGGTYVHGFMDGEINDIEVLNKGENVNFMKRPQKRSFRIM